MIWQGRIIQPVGSGDGNPTGGNGATNLVGDDSERGDTHADSSKKTLALSCVAADALRELETHSSDTGE